MQNMKCLGEIGGFAVNGILSQLDQHPELWNTNRMRTSFDHSPHRDADDIWVRYNAWENYDPENPQAFGNEHESVWYPAYDVLTSLSDVIFGIAFQVKAERIGGILITRIQPGKAVHPHSDTGWHAEYYDKYAVHLRAGPGQSFNFEGGESHCASPGEVYWFRNDTVHWVTNHSDQERITLIICLKKRFKGPA
jgi:hypothetical protein